jgi:hypothetical protein
MFLMVLTKSLVSSSSSAFFSSCSYHGKTVKAITECLSAQTNLRLLNNVVEQPFFLLIIWLRFTEKILAPGKLGSCENKLSVKFEFAEYIKIYEPGAFSSLTILGLVSCRITDLLPMARTSLVSPAWLISLQIQYEIDSFIC